jgi:two-component system, chemotaxis family, CheB/CheR fusion protein
VQLVALTGYGQPEDVARARTAGFDRHLKKPIDVDALSKLLSDLSATRHPAVH